jgi:hypothetical protein
VRLLAATTGTIALAVRNGTARSAGFFQSVDHVSVSIASGWARTRIVVLPATVLRRSDRCSLGMKNLEIL